MTDLERVLAFTGQLEQAVRGRLPATHWRIVLDADSVKLVVLGKPASLMRPGTLVDGEEAGYFYLRETITTTPDEVWAHFIDRGVKAMEGLVLRRMPRGPTGPVV